MRGTKWGWTAASVGALSFSLFSIAFGEPPTPPCSLTCPQNITRSDDPDQCGAVVTYSAPMTTGNCSTITCNPPSGGFFPVGTSEITCTNNPGGQMCSFGITVEDRQPPTITCPGNFHVPTQGETAIVDYPPANASDQCPGVIVGCVPPSGSVLPLGVTHVGCRAIDASNNTADCAFEVNVVLEKGAPAVDALGLVGLAIAMLGLGIFGRGRVRR